MRKLFDRENPLPRWRRCTQRSIGELSHAAGALYVQHHFDEENKREAITMIERIKAAFKELVDDLEWMDAKTRRIAIEKARV